MPERIKISRFRRKGEAAPPSPAGTGDFAELYRQHLRPVYSFVAYRVGHKQTAEDLTAQIFEKAWRSRSAYDPGRAEFSTWLFGIARNSITDHFRAGARAPESIPEVETQPAAGGDPLDELQALELRRDLMSAVATLEDREREILSLKFGARMNNRQIAELLEISESNAGTIVFRSLKKLRQRLEGSGDND